MIDRLLALIIFTLVSPVVLISALIIFLEDGFPIIFKQQRIGLFGVPFDFYKLRSMKKDTPSFPSNDLPNPEKFVLKSGRILRKLSIDELPNLINIIKGDMNIIGPRPLLASEKKLQNLRALNGIDLTKPGLTGWAQVNGRDNLDIETKLKLELYYKNNKSLTLKIKIILKSIIIVIKSSGIRF